MFRPIRTSDQVPYFPFRSVIFGVLIVSVVLAVGLVIHLGRE